MTNEILIIGVLVGQLTITSYQSVPSQTDSTPLHTSTREHVFTGGVAVSRNLLCLACRRLHKRCERPESASRLHYGQYVFIDGFGIYKINDAMGETAMDRKTKKRRPIVNAVDIWVGSYSEEKEIGTQFKNVYALGPCVAK